MKWTIDLLPSDLMLVLVCLCVCVCGNCKQQEGAIERNKWSRLGAFREIKQNPGVFPEFHILIICVLPKLRIAESFKLHGYCDELCMYPSSLSPLRAFFFTMASNEKMGDDSYLPKNLIHGILTQKETAREAGDCYRGAHLWVNEENQQQRRTIFS